MYSQGRSRSTNRTAHGTRVGTGPARVRSLLKSSPSDLATYTQVGQPGSRTILYSPTPTPVGPVRFAGAHVFTPSPSASAPCLQSWTLELDIRSQVVSQRPSLPLERSPCSPRTGTRALALWSLVAGLRIKILSEGWRWEALQQTSESCLGISQAAPWKSSRSSLGRHYHRGSRGQRAAAIDAIEEQP